MAKYNTCSTFWQKGILWHVWTGQEFLPDFFKLTTNLLCLSLLEQRPEEYTYSQSLALWMPLFLFSSRSPIAKDTRPLFTKISVCDKQNLHTCQLFHAEYVKSRTRRDNLHLGGKAQIQCGQVFLLERPQVPKNEPSHLYWNETWKIRNYGNRLAL